MSNEMVLEEKKYNHQDSVVLLEEVRNFFQGKLKMIGIEWFSEKKTQNSDGIVSADSQLFIIKKGNQPLYEKCNGTDDADRLLDQFDESLNNLLNNFDSLLDHNQNIDEDSKNSLESYANAIDKGITVFENQRKRRNSKFKELSTVEEVREELRQFLGEIISNYIIQVLVDALYARIKNNSGEVYILAVNEINKFLAENGVYTKEVSIGEEIDPEYVEPTQDSIDNVTDDFNKFDTIDEIRRYPYMFSDGTKILDGSAKIWRRKD